MNRHLTIVFVLCIAAASVSSMLAAAAQPVPGPVNPQARAPTGSSPPVSANTDNSGNANGANTIVSASSPPSFVEQVPSVITIDPSQEQLRIQQLLQDSERLSAQRMTQQLMEPATVQHMQQVQQQQLYYWQQQQAVLAAAQHAQQQQQQRREASSDGDSLPSRSVEASGNPPSNREFTTPPQSRQSTSEPRSTGSDNRVDGSSRMNRPSSFTAFAVADAEDMSWEMDSATDSSAQPFEFVTPISISPRSGVSSAYLFANEASNGNPTPAPGTNSRSQCQQQCSERLMDVTGVGVTSISPDKAEVRATIEHRVMVNTTLSQGVLEPKAMEELIQKVQTEVSTHAAAVVQYLKQNQDISSHISKLHTTGLSLEPLYEYVNNHMMLSGYRASNSITFRVDVAHAGEAVDSIVKQGVTRIDGVSFISSPKELAAARQVAIANAVEDGLQQALSALSGAGRLSGSFKTDLQIVPVNIVAVTRPEPDSMALSSLGYHRAMPAGAPIMRMEKSDLASTPIEGEERTISAAVVLKLRF